jgi:hypothetical protein
MPVGCEIRIHLVYEYKFSITYAAVTAKAIRLLKYYYFTLP